MAGIPLEVFEHAYDAEGIVAADSPVMYEVWREYAIRGPQARLRLLLRLAEDSNSADVADNLQRGSDQLRASESDAIVPSIGVIGEWVLIQTDLVQLVCILLPLTRWARPLRVVRSLSLGAIVDLLAPLDELLERHEEEPAEPAEQISPESATPAVQVTFTQRDQEVSSWLLRLLARIWGYDADLDSERVPAAEHLLSILSIMSFQGGDSQGGPEVLVSISLDRVATPAAIGSAQVIKADAARRLFEISASTQTWAVLDSGINARHPAFADHTGRLRTRIIETFDLVSLDDRDLALIDPRKAPIDHLVQVVQGCAVTPWDGSADSPYREPTSSHGTHVAGILAGYIPDTLEGICPDLRLWDFRVLDAKGEGNESRILLALRFIRHLNDQERAIRIAGVNMSISLAYDPKNHACGWTPVCEEVRRLVRSGVVVVVAAGNAGYQAAAYGAGGDPSRSLRLTGRSRGTGFETVSITDPGNTEEAITVGATHGQHPYRYGTSYFSGKGPTADGRLKPDLLAPGEHIVGPVGREGLVAMDGTSHAAPHVSGAAALLMARYPELIGQPERVKDILCRTATDLGRDHRFQGHGLVDVLRAAQSV